MAHHHQQASPGSEECRYGSEGLLLPCVWSQKSGRAGGRAPSYENEAVVAALAYETITHAMYTYHPTQVHLHRTAQAHAAAASVGARFNIITPHTLRCFCFFPASVGFASLMIWASHTPPPPHTWTNMFHPIHPSSLFHHTAPALTRRRDQGGRVNPSATPPHRNQTRPRPPAAAGRALAGFVGCAGV